MTYDANDPVFRIALIGLLLSLPFKIVGLWKSAQNNQKGWFGALLLLNTLGVLELIYLFYFAKPRSKQID